MPRREAFDWEVFFPENTPQDVEISPGRREAFDWSAFGLEDTQPIEITPAPPTPQPSATGIPQMDLGITPEPQQELDTIETPESSPVIAPKQKPSGFLGPIDIPKVSKEANDLNDYRSKLDAEQWVRTAQELPEITLQAFRNSVAGLTQFFGEIPLNFAFGPDIGTLAPGVAERSANLAREAEQLTGEAEKRIAGKAPFVYDSEHFGRIGEWEMGFWQRALENSVQSAALVGTTLPISVVTGSEVPVLSAFFFNEFGSAYANARMKGLKPAPAMNYALRNAGIEVLTELGPTRALLKNDEFIAKLINLYSKELPQESVATITQRVNSLLSGVEPDTPLPIFMASVFEDLKLTAASVAMTSPVQAGAARGIQKAAGMPTSPLEAYGMELGNMIGGARYGLDDVDHYVRAILGADNAQLRQQRGAPKVQTPETTPIISSTQPGGYFGAPLAQELGLPEFSPILPLIRTEPVEGESLVGTRITKSGITGLVVSDVDGVLQIITDEGYTAGVQKNDQVQILGDISNDPEADIDTVPPAPEPEVSEDGSGKKINKGESLTSLTTTAIEEPTPTPTNPEAQGFPWGVPIDGYTFHEEMSQDLDEILDLYTTEQITPKQYEFIKIALESKGRRKYGSEFSAAYKDAFEELEAKNPGKISNFIPAYSYAYEVAVNGKVPNKPKVKGPDKVKQTIKNKIPLQAQLTNKKVKDIHKAMKDVRKEFKDNPDVYNTPEKKVELFTNALYGLSETLSSNDIEKITELGVEEIAFALEEGTIDDAESIIRSADLIEPTPDAFEMKEHVDEAPLDYSSVSPLDYSNVTGEDLETFEVEMYFDKERELIRGMKDIIANAPEKVLPHEIIQNSLDAFPRRNGLVYKKGGKDNIIAVRFYHVSPYNAQVDEDIFVPLAMEYLGIDEATATEMYNERDGFDLIIMADNGVGMTKEQVQTVLVGVGTKGKSAQTSAGGYGQAKQAFFLYPEKVRVTTTKNGKTTTMEGTRQEFIGARPKGSVQDAMGRKTGTQIVMAISDRNEYSSFYTKNFIDYVHSVPKHIFGNVVYKTSLDGTGYSLHREKQELLPVGDILEYTDDYYDVGRLGDFSKMDYYKNIVKKRLKGSWKGNEYDIYIVHTSPNKHVPRHSGFYHVNTIWMSQGLPMNIEESAHPVAKIPETNEKPGFEVRINFTKLVDTTDPSYPYIDNRKSVNREIVTHINNEIVDLVQKASQEEAIERIQQFQEMHNTAPIYHGVKVYIPFVETSFRSEVEELIDNNSDVFVEFADIFNGFNQLLTSPEVGETNVKEMVITVDPNVYGWRSNPDVTGLEVYAINPFIFTSKMAANSDFNDLVKKGHRTPAELMAASFFETMVHEYAHNKVSGHAAKFANETGRLNTIFDSGDTAVDKMLFIRRMQNVFEQIIDQIDEVGSELQNYRTLASLIEDSEDSRPYSTTFQSGDSRPVETGEGATEEGGEGAGRDRIRLIRTLFGNQPRSDTVSAEGMSLLKKFYSKIDIETPWRHIGAPEVGFNLKNYASVKEFYDQETLSVIRSITTRGFTKEDYADIALMAEDPRLLDEAPPELRERLAPAVEIVRNYFDDTYAEFESLGILQNPFPQSKIMRLREDIDRAQIRMRDPEIDEEVLDNLINNITEWESQIQILANLKFVHIPAGLLLEQMDVVDPSATGRYRYMRILNQKRRKTISLMSLLEDEVVTKDQLDVRDIIANYGRRKGNDIAIYKIARAVHQDGLSKKAKRKIRDKWVRIAPPEGYVHMGDRYPAFNDYYVQRDVAEYLTKFFEYSYRLTGFDKFLAAIKGLQFERPDIMLWNNTVQALMLGSMRSIKTPWHLVEGFKQVYTMGPLYKEAVYNGLLSKPNNNPFAHYLEMVQHAKSPYLQKFFQLSNFTPWGAVKAYYNAAFYVAWKLDESIRMMSYLYLRNSKGFSARDAAQMAALAHADYASVPPEVRRALNRIWFTPTFKITMGKLWAQSAAATVKSPINLAQDASDKVRTMIGGIRTPQNVPDGAMQDRMRRRIIKSQKIRRLTSIALTAGMINLAIDLFMRMNGFDTNEEDMYWGVKYKKTFETDEGPKELVLSFSHPANLFLKFYWRAVDAAGVATGGWDKFLKSIKYEFHPFWRTILYDLSRNRQNNGELIWSPGDDPLAIAFKSIAYTTNQFIGLMGALSEEVFASDQDKETAERMALEFGAVTGRILDLFATAYMRSPLVNQILNENRDLRGLMMEEARKGKLTPEKNQNYLKKMLDNSKRIENEIRRSHKGASISNPFTGVVGAIASLKGANPSESINPVQVVIDDESNRLNVPSDRAHTNLNKMATFFAEIENRGKLTGKNPKSSAKGMYQIIDETFKSSVSYLTKTYTDKNLDVPEWLIRAAKHGNPNKLTKDQQTAVMLSNLFRTRGTDRYLRMVMENGDIEAMKKLYLKYHHTRPNKKLINKVDKIFRG